MKYPIDDRIRIEQWGERQLAIPENSVISRWEQPDDYQKLKRQTFEQMRDILYDKFHREYFDAAKAVEKYPDPAEREKAMQVHWIMDYENNWSQYLWNVESTYFDSKLTFDQHKEGIQEMSNKMRDVVAEYGERAWHVYVSDEEVMRVEKTRLAKLPADGPDSEPHPRDNDGSYKKALDEATSRGGSKVKDKGPTR